MDDDTSDRRSQPAFSGIRLVMGLLAGLAASLIVVILRRSSRRKSIHSGSLVAPTHDPASVIAVPLPFQSAQIPLAPQSPSSQPNQIVILAPRDQFGAAWSPTTKYIVAVGLFLFALVVIYISRSVLPLIVLGALIAFTVKPVIRFFQEKLRLRRGWAIILTYLLAFLIMLLLPLILIPSIISAIDLVSGIDFQSIIQDIRLGVIEFFTRVSVIPILGPILGSLLSPLLNSLQRITTETSGAALDLNIAYDELIGRLASTLGVLVRAVGAVASALVAIFFALFISIYLSFDAHKIRGLLPQLLPPANKEEIDALLHRLGLIWEAFLRGQITLMLMIGVIVWIGAVLLGLPQPVFFGFLSGTLEMIPSLGPLLAFIPAVIVALLFGSSHLPVTNLSFAVIIAAFYLLVQFFENQFIVPRVLGKAVDLHPLVVIIGALAAGSQFGVLGIFLAAPAIASGREIFLYLYSKILETPTPPPPLETKSIWKDIKSFFKRGRDALIRPFRRFVL